MNIAEMHVWFRQYAQQMGMQNVRAILPEQIDNLINTSTKDVIDELVHNNVGTTNDRVITDNAKLSTVNALRTLYKVKNFIISGDKVDKYKNNPLLFSSDIIEDAFYFVDFAIKYSNTASTTFANAEKVYADANKYYDEHKDLENPSSQILKQTRDLYYNAFEYYKSWIQDKNLDIDNTDIHDIDEFFGLYESPEFSLIATLLNDNFIPIRNKILNANENLTDGTRLFPIRIINEAYLADILNDWILSPRLRTPIMAIYSDNNNQEYTKFEIYLGENDEEGLASVSDKLYVYKIRCSYIKKPNKVRYVSDLGGNNVNSDLPDQLQIPMLKHAVDLYRTSVQGAMFTNQQAGQAQQQEMARNNVRPDNDGYQS